MPESPNTLLSNSELTILDLVGNGQVSGFIRHTGAFGNDPLCSTYYDDVPVRNSDGSYNFNVSGQGYTFDYTFGTTAQTGIPGFQKVENIIPLSSNTRVANPPVGAGPWKPVIASFTTATYPDADSLKVTVRVPALYSQDSNGNVNPYGINYAVDISLNNGPWVQQAEVAGTPATDIKITGKCTTPFLETTLFPLPKPTVPTASSEWKVRVRRTDQNVLATSTQNELYVDTIAVVSTNLYAYPNSVLVGTKISADQFSSIPSRAYEIAGLLVNVPSGYQPTQYPPYDFNFSRQCDIDLGVRHIGFTTQDPAQLANVYTGTRVAGAGIPAGSVIVATNPDGPYFFTIDQDPTATNYNTAVTFTNASDTGILPAQYPPIWYGNYVSGVWTDNPAWIFNDLLTNQTRGLGDFIQSGAVDKWTLYGIAQYCDQMVDDGAGGLEPNFTCNVAIQQPDDAYSVLLNLASTFRGMLYYGNGTIHATQTSNKTPSFAFTNANVVDGKFSYSDTSQNTRSTVAMVKWVDPKNGYRENVEYIEDIDGIQRYGYQEKQVTAFACTSKGQAYRLGSWTLQTERLLTETITFQTDLEGFSIAPGEAFAVYDNFRNNRSQGGRVIGFDPTRSLITLDRNVSLTSGFTYSLTTIIPKFTLDGTGDLTGSNQIPFIDQSQIETYLIATPPTLTTKQLLISGTFSTGLFVGTPWVLAASGSSSIFQNASFYTCLATAEIEPGKIEILGLQANTGINFVISTGYTTASYPVNSGDHSPIDPPTNFTVVEITGATVPDNTFYDVIRLTWKNTPSLRLAYYVISGRAFDEGYQGYTTFGTGFDFPRTSTGQYTFRMAAVSYGNVQSSFVTGGIQILSGNPLGTLKPLSGVQIIEDFDPLYRTFGATYTGYTGYMGTTPTFSWDSVKATNAVPGFLQDLPIVDFQFILNYHVSLKSFDGSTDYVTPFVLTGSDTTMWEVPSGTLYNAIGGQRRGFLFKVDTEDIYGNIAPGASLAVNNPPPRPPFSSGFVGYNGGILYNVTPAADNDISGIYVWYNPSNGFTPTPSNVNFVSENVAGSINNAIYQLTPYYLWYSLVDTFGISGCPIYGPISVDPNGSVSGAYFNLNQSIQAVQASMTGASGILSAQVIAVQTALATTGSALAQWLTYLSVQTTGVTSSVTLLTSAQITGASNGTGGAALAVWGFELNANGKAIGVKATATSFNGIADYNKMVFSGVSLQSDTFVPGLSGWRLTPSGDFEGNKGNFRGQVFIASGTNNQVILGTTTAGNDGLTIGGGSNALGDRITINATQDVFTPRELVSWNSQNRTTANIGNGGDNAGVIQVWTSGGTDFPTQNIWLQGKNGGIYTFGPVTGQTFRFQSGLISQNTNFSTWQGQLGVNLHGFNLKIQEDVLPAGIAILKAGGGNPSISFSANGSVFGASGDVGTNSEVSSINSAIYYSGGWNQIGHESFGVSETGGIPFYRLQLLPVSSALPVQTLIYNYDGKLYFTAPNDVFSPFAGIYAAPSYMADPKSNIYRAGTNSMATDGNFGISGLLTYGTLAAVGVGAYAGYITIQTMNGFTLKIQTFL